jgi:hypothetical protein
MVENVIPAFNSRRANGRNDQPDLCDVETCEALVKHITFYQQVEKVAAAHILEDLLIKW